MRVENDLKPHNVETIKQILEFYKTSNKCCAIQATGTGKTFLILRLLEIYNDMDKNAVIFAPNREIINQTKKRMKKFGLNNATFYTYQKLARMTDEEIENINADLIVCDELHRTGAKTWGQKFEVLVETHSDSKVFGVTATPLRCADGRDMSEEYFDGNKACDISLAEALVRKIIPVMPVYVSALYTFEEEYKNMSDKIENARNTNEEKVELMKELKAAKQQLEKSNGIPEIIKKYITNYNGKYIVFCKDKKHLYAMKDVVVQWFREAGYNGEIFCYPYYSCSKEVKKNLYNFENNTENGLKLLFVIDKLNEGLHLDTIHGCILLRTTTSNIIYYQQIGRAIDAGCNQKRVILDLVSNFNSLKSFNLKNELNKKVIERQSGRFSECDNEFDIGEFQVNDYIQECVDIFNKIDKSIFKDEWTKDEDAIVIEKFPLVGSECYKFLKNRTRQATSTRAYRLGIKFAKEIVDWSDTEENDLIKFYPIEGIKCFTRFPTKTERQIRWKVTQMGLKYEKNRPYDKSELAIINRYYIDEGNDIIKRLPNRSLHSIVTQAKSMGLYRTDYIDWTNEEENIIRTFAANNIQECYKRINKPKVKIRSKAQAMGIHYQREFVKWTKEEDNIILNNYIYGYQELMKLLPNRTYQAISTRLKNLKLKVPKTSFQYNRNTKSGYKYVYPVTDSDSKWYVMIKINGENINFGTYDDVDEAGRVATEKAKEYGKV